MDAELLKTALLTLFVAVDPPGLAPVFVSLTAHMSSPERRSTALYAVGIAFAILALSAVGGRPFLEMLGISIPAFRIAGGLLLFLIAVEMVFEKREQRRSHSAETAVAHDHHKSIAAFPLAMPLMAGPGAITATILQASNAQGSMADMAALVGVIALVIFSCLPVFLMAGHIDRWLGVSGRVIISRLLGVLLAAMAVQTIGDGIVAFMRAAS
jgi:multiple antibiotic resistance protein